MRLIIAIIAVLWPSAVYADDVRPTPASVYTAIDRGLAFMVKDALAWKAQHNCVSCHHASMVVWSMREARQLGHVVAEPVLADLTKWIAESGDGKTGVSRPAGIPAALNAKAVWFALALEADPTPDAAAQNELKLLWNTVRGDQTGKGSWLSWPDTRAPIFGDLVTADVSCDTGADSRGSERGCRYESRSRPGSQVACGDEDGSRPAVGCDGLVLWKRLAGRTPSCARWYAVSGSGRTPMGAGASERTWRATHGPPGRRSMPGHAGVKTGDRVITRAQTFLINTQREDGSWPMTSRPAKPGGKGAASLIPITGAGSAWGVLGLVRRPAHITAIDYLLKVASMFAGHVGAAQIPHNQPDPPP